MVDPPEALSILEKSNLAATDRARRAVAAVFDLDELAVDVLPELAQRRCRIVWRVRLDDATLPVSSLLLAIPWTFPDELPDVYLPEDIVRLGTRIPHLSAQRQLCTFDDTVAWPNTDLAGEAVCRVIEKAVQLLRDGVSGANTGDYADEFEAYWGDAAQELTAALAVVRPELPHRPIVSLRLTSPLGPYQTLFADTSDNAVAFLDAIGRAPQKPEPSSVLYLHLGDFGGPPRIVTNADAFRCVSADPTAQEALLAFLKQTKRPSTVLFSTPVRGERVLGAWTHQRYRMDVYRGKDSRRILDQAPGFRPGHLPPQEELTSAFSNLAVSRIVVRRADDVRLMTRTAGELQSTNDSVTVIGCGSLGGFVADAARHTRPSRLLLVDPQVLEVHNVPRHFCDMMAVGVNKAHAMRTALRRHDPHVRFDADDRDVLEVLRIDAGALTPATWTFVAVANVAVERRLNALSRQLDFGTLVYLWIEPHAIAGHAVVVPPSACGCFECLLDETLSVNVRVLQNPEKFELVDAGCRGTFLPYSGLDMQTFAYTITRVVLTRGSGNGGIVTWVGDLDRARREGWRIHDHWATAAAFSIHEESIPVRPDCPICRGPAECATP